MQSNTTAATTYEQKVLAQIMEEIQSNINLGVVQADGTRKKPLFRSDAVVPVVRVLRPYKARIFAMALRRQGIDVPTIPTEEMLLEKPFFDRWKESLIDAARELIPFLEGEHEFITHHRNRPAAKSAAESTLQAA